MPVTLYVPLNTRMPVTLYLEQWERLLDFGDEIREFIREHDGELKRKEK